MTKTKEELLDLAKTYEETILSNDLTRADVVMLLALIDARVKAKLNQSLPSAPVVASTIAPIETIETHTAITPTRKKEIVYDPIYDPAPPFAVETPPPQTQPTGAVMAQNGYACVCNACSKVVYMVNRDIPDNCKIPYFIESFTPMDATTPPLTRKADIMNVDGQISTDCPVCRASKTLYLTGKR